MLKFIKSKFKRIINYNYKDYINTSIIFLTFVISCLINSTLLRCFTVKNYFDYRPLIADVAFLIIIGSLAYLIKPKNRFKYFLILSILFTSFIVADSIYYTFYMSFSSLSLLTTATQVVDVGDAIIKNVLQIKDYVYIWQVIFLIIVHKILSKREYYVKISQVEIPKKKLINTGLFGLLLTGIFVLSLSSVDINRLNKQWNREYILRRFGFFTYHLNDTINSLEPKIDSEFKYDTAYKDFRDYYNKKKTGLSNNQYTNIFKDKNVIMIHAESIQSVAMKTDFNGIEVTPNLNKLAKEGINFTNFYSQVSVGTSSDTEFTLNTSLLPVNSGTVFVSYSDRKYVSLPNLLKKKGYYTFSMHSNSGDFWNRNVMHKNLGYDKFYSKDSYIIDEEIGLGLSDKSFFRQSIPMINSIKNSENKPFYSTMIMLSNHTPFDNIDKYGEYKVTKTVNKIEYPYLEGTTLGNYFKSVHYADSAIGEFIKGLDKAGLLDNTVIVIYGDHDARLNIKDYNLMYNYDYINNSIFDTKDPNYDEFDSYDYELNRKVPFIIWTKDQKFNKEINTVTGMIDVLPTLGNMLGVYSKYQLGTDVMNLTDNTVIFPNGNFITNKAYYNSSKEEFITLLNEPINDKYINSRIELTDKLLNVSNNTIVFDLIKKDLEENKK